MSNTLNPAQREAIRYRDGPCLVIAGAGSGKTRVITQKIAALVGAGHAPESIAAITFTNKAAREMESRLGSLIKLESRARPTVCTFHSLGMQILRAEGESAGLKRNFSILDADDSLGIITQALGTTDRKAARAVQHTISLWKNAMVDPDAAIGTQGSAAPGVAANIAAANIATAHAYRDYAATLAAYQAVDFDDLILRPVQLLRDHPEALARWRGKLRYLLVDEYQDTNATQYELLKLLVGPRAAFTAVGDDDQSIYGWRGATLENLRRLQTDYPELKVIKLEQNYRSSNTILGVANALIGKNPKLHEKKLWSAHGVGDPVTVVACEDDEKEAESIVMRISAARFERQAKWSDFAVLYRGNHQARVIEQTLRKEKIDYVLSGGQSFFERTEIRDLLAYLRLIANDDDDPAFIRAVTTPKRGIGTTTLQALGEYAGQRHVSMFAALFETGAQTRLGPRQLEPLQRFGEFINRIAWRAAREPAGQVIDDLVRAIDYREHLFGLHDDKTATQRWQYVEDFTGWIRRRAEEDGSTLLQQAQAISLLSQLDRDNDDVDAVRLTTIHAAKGLEFPHVFVVGCEEGILPHRGSIDDDEGDPPDADAISARIEEERRLMYVAVTRAQRTLTLSWCQARRRAKEKLGCTPSRFIEEMGLSPSTAGRTTVTGDAARERLGRLKAMLVKPAPLAEK